VQQITADATAGLYGLTRRLSTDSFGQIARTSIVPNFPSEFADAKPADITHGQMFNFYFRSLKPSLFRHDQEAKAPTSIGPKGVVKFQPIITQLSESYNPS